MQPQFNKGYGALLTLVLCSLVWFPVVTGAGATHECTEEKRNDEAVCVFRHVVYRAKDADVVFQAPASMPKVQHVVFEDSTLEHLPGELLTAFPDLRALDVRQANLSSVVIPAKLERLYASDNRISRVVVHQTKESTTMVELILDSNQLSDITNLTRLAKLEILGLSGNKQLPESDTVDLGRFKGLDSLRSLMLADVDMMYVENKDNVALPALELLDVSKNTLITSNLDMKVFAPLKQLQYLWIMHTLISDLDALQLTQNNPNLKEVHLEGSNFKCKQQRLIVDHLHSKGIVTPVANKNVACHMGFEKHDDMCCQTELLDNIVRPFNANTSPVPPYGTKGRVDEDATNPPAVPRTPAPSSERPSTVAPKTTQTTTGKGNAASLVTLAGGMLSLTFLAIHINGMGLF